MYWEYTSYTKSVHGFHSNFVGGGTNFCMKFGFWRKFAKKGVSIEILLFDEKPELISPHSQINLSTVLESVDQMKQVFVEILSVTDFLSL